MRVFRFVMCTALLLMLADMAKAYDDPDSRATLKGISSIHVAVSVCDDLKGIIDEIDILTDAELRLRQSGIRVLSTEDLPGTKPSGWLYVSLACVKADNSTVFALGPDVAFRQWATLPRDPSNLVWAETWSVGTTAISGASNVRTARDAARGYVDQFLNAYLAANPKPAAGR